MRDGQLPNLGALLGAAGLLDVRSVREAEGKTLTELAAAFVNERLEEASQKGSAEAQWLKRFGFDVSKNGVYLGLLNALRANKVQLVGVVLTLVWLLSTSVLMLRRASA